jgi:Flp pilus assembly protein TadG
VLIRSRGRRDTSRARGRGQALVEFALVVPIFMIIIGGIIQFGVIFWGQNSLNQVVRDAGRYAVTEPDCVLLPDGSSVVADVRAKILSIASSMGVAKITGTPGVTMPTSGEVVGGTADPVSSTSVTGVNCPAKTNADHVWLRIAVNAQVPIFFPAVPGNGNISSTALFRMEPVATP